MTREYTGNVCLDLTYDKGNDSCADEAELDEILRIVQSSEEREYSRIIAEKRSVMMLYHLSAQRQNIVAGLEIGKDQDVLEIGSECGVITGKLAQMAGSVTCAEVSEKKSRINAWRNRDCDHVEIRVGKFEDLHADLDRQYDVITMIGTLENLNTCLTGELSAERLLRMALRHLKPQGKIVIALDNKYGLKYWAGCRDEWSGEFFGGLKAYADEAEAQSHTLNSLKNLLDRTGLTEQRYFYPYPDYRYTRCLYSDDYLPGKGELTVNMNNFGTERMFLFNETQVYDNLISDGLFPLFSNSYLVVCRGKESQE
ncbi:MAG: class I SAM-dependent methyltransferase [Clostridiales bacterium]|nr:class I SAM-dependent methyltransferase [Clostridiales bacterium]